MWSKSVTPWRRSYHCVLSSEDLEFETHFLNIYFFSFAFVISFSLSYLFFSSSLSLKLNLSMSVIDSIAMMSETELMRRGSVTKQQIVEALVATRKQLIEVEAKKATENTKLEEMFDRKLGPLLNYITEIRTKIEELNDSVKRVQDKCTELEAERRNDEESIFREFEDRHRRRKYLIISGLPEGSSGSLEERRVSDRDAVKELAANIGVADLDIESHQVSRIGPLNSSRPRLLRVKCDTNEEKHSMLRSSKKLRDFEEYRGIYINPDLTLKQRELGKIQRQELKRRREAGEDVVIRRGQITVKPNFQ